MEHKRTGQIKTLNIRQTVMLWCVCSIPVFVWCTVVHINECVEVYAVIVFVPLINTRAKAVQLLDTEQ